MSFIKKLYISVTNPKGYRELVSEGVRNGLKYIIILSLLSGLVSFIFPAIDYSEFINIVEEEVNNGFPEFDLIDGKLDVKGDEPKIIERKDRPIVIIDTTGNIKESELNKYEKCILILKNKVYYKKNNYKIDEAQYDFLGNVELNKQKTKELIPKLKLATYLIWIVPSILMVFFNYFIAFIIFLWGILMNAFLKWPLKFREIYCVGLYSITTAILITSLLRILNISFRLNYYLYIVAGCIYGLLAILMMVNNIEELENI